MARKTKARRAARDEIIKKRAVISHEDKDCDGKERSWGCAFDIPWKSRRNLRDVNKAERDQTFEQKCARQKARGDARSGNDKR